ncbi:MAG: glycosyltransferase, partial [Bacteroidales bacterium]|nr:glycosyltransferase [Bacteroidales bacterium]
GKPIVWTMHDMWPCTGICHHARECNGYYSDCASCPFTASPTLAKSTLAKKKQIWDKLNVTFVTCSKWLQERTSHSVLMTDKKVLSIPNPIDTRIFTPKEQKTCREHFGLPKEKTLLLFGAVKASDKRKGIEYMKAAVQLLVEKYPGWKENLELAIFGKSELDMQELFPVKVHQIPYITSEQEMIQLYNTADLYVTSSLEENLPNTIMEAMSCGVPCAGFNIGGIPEMIDHLENGYVATYKSADDLADGIHQLLQQADFAQLKQKAREKVIRSYSFASVAKRYIDVYTQLIEPVK